MDLLGDLLQRSSVRVYPDVELSRVLPSTLDYKETVSGPDVDNYSFAVGSNEFFEGGAIELSNSSATDSFQHAALLSKLGADFFFNKAEETRDKGNPYLIPTII